MGVVAGADGAAVAFVGVRLIRVERGRWHRADPATVERSARAAGLSALEVPSVKLDLFRFTCRHA